MTVIDRTDRNECVGPRGQVVPGEPSGCPTFPRYHLQLEDTETWSCERHLSQAVKGFKVSEPVTIAVSVATVAA